MCAGTPTCSRVHCEPIEIIKRKTFFCPAKCRTKKRSFSLTVIYTCYYYSQVSTPRTHTYTQVSRVIDRFAFAPSPPIKILLAIIGSKLVDPSRNIAFLFILIRVLAVNVFFFFGAETICSIVCLFVCLLFFFL